MKQPYIDSQKMKPFRHPILMIIGSGITRIQVYNLGIWVPLIQPYHIFE